jgi:putative oxidoreductase
MEAALANRTRATPRVIHELRYGTSAFGDCYSIKSDARKHGAMFLFEWLSRYPFASWAPIPLRLIVGYGFMEHGFTKLARGPDAFPAILHAIGVPAPHFMAWATILVEVLGGLAVLLGAFVTLVSIPMAVVLLVATFTVHLPYGFSSIKLMAVTAAGAQFGQPGYETDLLYLACLAALVLGGPGPLAIDGLLRKRKGWGQRAAGSI